MSEPFPPANFILAESAVEGIEVYMPAPPPPEEHQEIVEFKCPQCAATTAYSVADGGLTCTYCGYYEPPKQPIVGKGAEEFEFKIETVLRSAEGWGQARKELQCQNCGASTSVPPEMLAYTCPFCGSNRVIQREAHQDVLRPRFLIAFKIESDACLKTAREWLGSSWMTPGSLQKLAQFGSFTPVYIPFWTFDTDACADWRAEVAHTKTKRTWSGGKWRTRRVTEWKWESGHVELNVDDLLVAGSTHLSKFLLEQINGYDLDALVPYEPNYLAGLRAQAYEVTLEAAWETGRKKIREMTRQACRSQASRPRIRNFSMTLNFENESWRYILLPVYVAPYRFENRTFQVIVNGQTGAIAGQRPPSWWKVGLASLGVVTPGLILCIVGAFTLFFAMIGLIIGMIGLVLLVMGMGLAIPWIQQAMRMDDD